MIAEFSDDGVKPENSYRVTLERGLVVRMNGCFGLT